MAPTPSQTGEEQAFALTPAYDILLRGSEQMPIGLYHLHIAKAEQLCRLHYSPKSIKLIKARLKALADNHYIQEDWTPTRRLRSPYIYTLDKKGIEHIRDIGWDIPDSFRASKEVGQNYLFIEHTLGLNDVIISAALLQRKAPHYYLNKFIHERALKQKPYKASYQGERLTLIPDAFMDFRHTLPDGRTGQVAILLEHDCGTEQQRQFRRKVRAYIMLLKSEAYKEGFKVKAIRIAFTTFKDKKRLEKMREWTRQELDGEPKELYNSFLLTNQQQPPDPRYIWLEACWYTADGEQPVALLGG